MSDLAGIVGISAEAMVSSAETMAERASQSTDVAKAFEGIFASLLVKQMRSTGLGEGLFSGEKSDTLGGLFDMFLGQHLAKSEGLGVAKMIQKYVDTTKEL